MIGQSVMTTPSLLTVGDNFRIVGKPEVMAQIDSSGDYFGLARFSEVGPRHNFQERHQRRDCPAIPIRFTFWCTSRHAAGVLLSGGSAALCVDATDENGGISPSGNVG